MYTVIGVLLLATALPAFGDRCSQLYEAYDLSPNYNETIAHAIHSFTLNELRKFNSEASVTNGVPVVNPRLNDPTTRVRVLDNAPLETIGMDFEGEAMNTVDVILSQIGQPTDGLGPNWSPLERVVHKFHMKDLWEKLMPIYSLMDQPDEDLCACLTDTKNNGIFEAVDWVARHYKSGTPITLLNRPIPKLTDAKTWAVWKVRLLHYYDSQALNDAATYLRCALDSH